MSFRAIFHIALHFLIPLGVAWIFFRSDYKKAFLFMLLGMLIDLDHLLATPIFAANRCSLGFHPFHSWPFITGYGLLLFVPSQKVRWIALGLLIHIGLDGVDCWWMKCA